MRPFKKLAGQTAIYGLPSILGRTLGYLLVPLYTRVFDKSDYGTIILLYSYVSFLLVILTYGMETAFFRFSQTKNNKNIAFSTAFISLVITTLIFAFLSIKFSQNIANIILYPDNNNYVICFSLIISFDVLSAIPFAKLRADNNPKRFAIIKFTNISINIFLNLFFILLCPFLLANYNDSSLASLIKLFFISDNLISYVFISNLIASFITLLLLSSDFLKIKFRFNYILWRQMLIYAFPLLIAGLAGIMNETLDRILLRYLLPSQIAEDQVGIYGACYKIAIFMSLFIQAFRYAAEPFFFSHAKEKDAKVLYSQIMNYFVITVSFIFLLTMMYIDVIILFIGEEFRVGAAVIPILLLANLFLGIYYNLSVWFKLTNNTKFGAFLSIFGAIITLSLNFYLIPIIGFMGSAWATLACYFSMTILSYFLGQKYYQVKYNIKKIIAYILLSVLFLFLSKLFNFELQSIRLIFNTIILIIFVAIVYFIEFNKNKI
ncbi:MAG: polysaccharide biosynthesis C-terminal domain-containing protein [Bacteroidales bacterium]|nr:polysaccharide biosynthesis C-terminal domain-containing protein [Bacteroidales bacterium]